MKVLLAITGGIAAYKMLSVASDLTKKGHEVEVCMTQDAQKFVTPLSFEAITHKKVVLKDSDFLHDCVNQHIALGQNNDIMVVAPATANTIAKLAYGISDNIVTLTALASTCYKIIIPSMNNIMYEADITQENIKKLQNRNGYEVYQPDKGYLACGSFGRGRLPEPGEIVKLIEKHLKYKGEEC